MEATAMKIGKSPSRSIQFIDYHCARQIRMSQNLGNVLERLVQGAASAPFLQASQLRFFNYGGKSWSGVEAIFALGEELSGVLIWGCGNAESVLRCPHSSGPFWNLTLLRLCPISVQK
jgi:hypothetical protein